MTRIENENQYNAALERIEELLKVVSDETAETDRNFVELDLLSGLVADYENEHYPVSKPTLIEVLKLRMFELGLSQNSLASLLGMNQSKVSEIITGKCEPTLKQARTIARVLNISPAIVLGV